MINTFRFRKKLENWASYLVRNSRNCDSREAGNWAMGIYVSESSQTHSEKSRVDFLASRSKNNSICNLKKNIPHKKRPSKQKKSHEPWHFENQSCFFFCRIVSFCRKSWHWRKLKTIKDKLLVHRTADVRIHDKKKKSDVKPILSIYWSVSLKKSRIVFIVFTNFDESCFLHSLGMWPAPAYACRHVFSRVACEKRLRTFWVVPCRGINIQVH